MVKHVSKMVLMRRRRPLLYWVTLAYVVGIPNFVHFDPTGRTPDPINLTSVMSIIQTFVSGYLLFVCLLLERRRVHWPWHNISVWLWVALLLQFTLASLLQPAFRISPPAKTDLLLSVFMMGQWVVAFLLVVVVYSHSFLGRASDLVVSLIGRASWIWIAMVWVLLPVIPGHVYGESSESAMGLRQLGGELIHPGKLAVLSGIGFFYALFYFPLGPRKWIACLLALVTIALTGARTAELAFVMAVLLYTLFLSRHALMRWGTALGLIGAVAMGLTFSSALMRYISRGQSVQTLASLNDRTRIWQASWEAIRIRPVLGYGYVIGAKKALREHWEFTHWIPPHSHNEFIGAVVDGGIIALALVLSIYGLTLWRLCRTGLRGQGLFLLLVFIQLLVSTVSGPILSYRYGTLGGIFVLCCIGVLGMDSLNRTFSIRLCQLDRHTQTPTAVIHA
jgi:O-Antigen ligase